MDVDFGPTPLQVKMLAAFLSDGEFAKKNFKKLTPAVEQHFSAPLRPIVAAMKELYERTAQLDPTDILAVASKHRIYRKLDEKHSAKKAMQAILKASRKRNYDYAKDHFSDFCTALNVSILLNSAASSMASGNIDVAVNTIHSFSAEEAAEPFETLSNLADIGNGINLRREFGTDLPKLDKVLNGGFARGELAVLCGMTGVGKTTLLIYFGARQLMKGYKVLHCFIEQRMPVIKLKYIQAMLNMTVEEITQLGEQALVSEFGRAAIELDVLSNINIGQCVDWTPAKLRAKLRELARCGNKPDVLVLDYADELSSELTSKDVRLQQKEIYRSLSKMAAEFDIAVITASQAGRIAKGLELVDGTMASESQDKPRIADVFIGISQIPLRRRRDQFVFFVDKFREGRDQARILVNLDRARIHITDLGKMTWDPEEPAPENEDGTKKEFGQGRRRDSKYEKEKQKRRDYRNATLAKRAKEKLVN